MKPKKTDATTDMYIPTAADARRLVRLLGDVREASKPVIVYWAISRPREHEYQNTRLRTRSSRRRPSRSR